MRLLCATFMTVLICAAPAKASAPAAWQHRALTTAQQVWHPGCGQLRIEWQDPALAGGTAEWGGWAYLGECTLYEPSTRRWLGYPDFCTAVLHEAGHAAGLGHSARGIMVAQRMIARNDAREDGRPLVSWSGADSRCLRHGRDRAARY